MFSVSVQNSKTLKSTKDKNTNKDLKKNSIFICTV